MYITYTIYNDKNKIINAIKMLKIIYLFLKNFSSKLSD